MNASTVQYRRLLAKSSKSPDSPRRSETLEGHLLDVMQTAQALVCSSGLGALRSLGLDDAMVRDLDAAVIRGAFLHDLGKANHQFQRMIRTGSGHRQALRHEWISVWLILRFQELDRWLFDGCSEGIRYAALFAALGHHLKVEDGSSISERAESGDDRVVVPCDHEDFQSCLKMAADKLSRAGISALPDLEIDLSNRPLAELRMWLVPAFDWHRNSDDSTRRFVALVKALVIAADVAGSAVPKKGEKPERWAKLVLQRACTEAELKTVAFARLDGKGIRPFQKEMASTSDRVVFVRAGCGSGKTVGAYLWAARHAHGKKLFFCYPTTGTATEGFRDYVIPSEMNADAALIHSRSEVDLEAIMDAPDDDVLERAARIEALGAWDVPLVLCTTDLVLGLMQNNRRGLFSFPPIVNGAFVFDEIHQYDDRLLGSLLRFLEGFRGAPTLLMTASLPAPRLEAIKRVLDEVDTRLHVVQGPPELEQIKRYRLTGLVEEPPWSTVEETLSRNGRVLWVANTVDRAVGFAKEARQRGFNPIVYHSRYRYRDRLQKHTAVINAFKTSKAALAITTQVCEVSLDLSADLLISDLAPIPALIQRLGRLNRRVTPERPSEPRPAIFLEPNSIFPYDKDEFDPSIVRKWIAELSSGPVSQSELAEAFERFENNRAVPCCESAWLDGGPFSKPAPLREATATVGVIRSEDEATCLNPKSRPDAKQIVRHSIPMTLGPVAREIGGWKRIGSAFVVPEGRIDYSEEWGARWA